MPDDIAPNAPVMNMDALLPGSNYTAGRNVNGILKVPQAQNALQTAQTLESTNATVGATVATLQRLDGAAFRHGMNPNLQGQIGGEEAFLTQTITATLDPNDPNAGTIKQMLVQQAQDNATPINPFGIRPPRLGT